MLVVRSCLVVVFTVVNKPSRNKYFGLLMTIVVSNEILVLLQEIGLHFEAKQYSHPSVLSLKLHQENSQGKELNSFKYPIVLKLAFQFNDCCI